ncbi:core-binding factor subunit beta isoform X1 [Nerophis ophidion]|uniref:core-binding factor subunit beta isoform X1 n=1 Tax=Nerophis ophidion TaxID=159077 RepID=UPI002AE06A7E|nr:core-binding factor subunit beta isoform X1 [Nerophis ophidion]
MPRVVPDQRSKFENEEFFRKLSRECEIKYTGFRDRPHEERQARFQNACRDGRSEIAFVATGTNLSLQFFPANLHGDQRQVPTREYVDFERETGKVHLKAPMILNGVCVIWRGWIDLQRLDGMGLLEYDDERAQHEDALAQAAFEEARRRTRDFEERERSHREDLENEGYCFRDAPHNWLQEKESILMLEQQHQQLFPCLSHTLYKHIQRLARKKLRVCKHD